MRCGTESGGTTSRYIADTAYDADHIREAITAKNAPDGRGWRADACPALHPVDRVCQAYKVRPLVCRGFYSASAAACERIATTGEVADGPVQTHGLLVLAFEVMSYALNGDAAASYDLKAGLAALRDGADDFGAVLELARLS